MMRRLLVAILVLVTWPAQAKETLAGLHDTEIAVLVEEIDKWEDPRWRGDARLHLLLRGAVDAHSQWPDRIRQGLLDQFADPDRAFVPDYRTLEAIMASPANQPLIDAMLQCLEQMSYQPRHGSVASVGLPVLAYLAYITGSSKSGDRHLERLRVASWQAPYGINVPCGMATMLFDKGLPAAGYRFAEVTGCSSAVEPEVLLELAGTHPSPEWESVIRESVLHLPSYLQPEHLDSRLHLAMGRIEEAWKSLCPSKTDPCTLSRELEFLGDVSFLERPELATTANAAYTRLLGPTGDPSVLKSLSQSQIAGAFRFLVVNSAVLHQDDTADLITSLATLLSWEAFNDWRIVRLTEWLESGAKRLPDSVLRILALKAGVLVKEIPASSPPSDRLSIARFCLAVGRTDLAKEAITAACQQADCKTLRLPELERLLKLHAQVGSTECLAALVDRCLGTIDEDMRHRESSEFERLRARGMFAAGFLGHAASELAAATKPIVAWVAGETEHIRELVLKRNEQRATETVQTVTYSSGVTTTTNVPLDEDDEPDFYHRVVADNHLQEALESLTLLARIIIDHPDQLAASRLSDALSDLEPLLENHFHRLEVLRAMALIAPPGPKRQAAFLQLAEESLAIGLAQGDPEYIDLDALLADFESARMPSNETSLPVDGAPLLSLTLEKLSSDWVRSLDPYLVSSTTKRKQGGHIGLRRSLVMRTIDPAWRASYLDTQNDNPLGY